MRIKSTLSEKQIQEINLALEELAQTQLYRYPRKYEFIRQANSDAKSNAKRQKTQRLDSLYIKKKLCIFHLFNIARSLN